MCISVARSTDPQLQSCILQRQNSAAVTLELEWKLDFNAQSTMTVISGRSCETAAAGASEILVTFQNEFLLEEPTHMGVN